MFGPSEATGLSRASLQVYGTLDGGANREIQQHTPESRRFKDKTAGSSIFGRFRKEEKHTGRENLKNVRSISSQETLGGLLPGSFTGN
jgi:hypothetical protein